MPVNPRRLLQIAVSIALAAVLLYVANIGELLQTIRKCDLVWALAAIGVFMFDRVIMSYKWTLLLKAQGHPLGLLAAMEIYCSSMVWGMALPSTVGADAIRAALIRARGISWSDGIATMMVERGIGFVIALLFGVAGAVILRLALPPDRKFDLLLLVVLGTLIAAAGLVAFSFSPRAFALLETLAPGFVRHSKPMRVIEGLHGAYRNVGEDRRLLATFTVWTAVEQCFSIIVSWVIAKSLGVDATSMLLLAAVPLAMIASRLPLSFDGIGVFEGVFVAIMALAGFEPADSLAIALCGRVFQTVAWLPWWGMQVARMGSLRPPITA